MLEAPSASLSVPLQKKPRLLSQCKHKSLAVSDYSFRIRKSALRCLGGTVIVAVTPCLIKCRLLLDNRCLLPLSPRGAEEFLEIPSNPPRGWVQMPGGGGGQPTKRPPSLRMDAAQGCCCFPGRNSMRGATQPPPPFQVRLCAFWVGCGDQRESLQLQLAQVNLPQFGRWRRCSAFWVENSEERFECPKYAECLFWISCGLLMILGLCCVYPAFLFSEYLDVFKSIFDRLSSSSFFFFPG